MLNKKINLLNQSFYKTLEGNYSEDQILNLLAELKSNKVVIFETFDYDVVDKLKEEGFYVQAKLSATSENSIDVTVKYERYEPNKSYDIIATYENVEELYNRKLKHLKHEELPFVQMIRFGKNEKIYEVYDEELDMNLYSNDKDGYFE